MVKLLLTILFITSCGTLGKHEPKPHDEPLDELKIIEQAILDKLPERQDEHGWINSDKCDALLFSGILHSLVGGVDLLAGKDEETGRWYRTPFKDCYRNYKSQRNSTRKSKSACSRDGFTGLAWAFSNNAVLGRKESRRILRYGRRNGWVMCNGVLSRTILSPNLQRTFALIADEPEPILPDLWSYPESQSARHLAVFHILIRGRIVGGITDDMLSIIDQAYSDQPKNALFSFAYHHYHNGDQSLTVAILHRLYPNTTCKPWLWIEPEHKWTDCGEENSNAEFLLVIKLLRDSHVNNS